MFLLIYSIFVFIFGAIMVGIYIRNYKSLPIDTWKPGAAWTRAMIYFSFCNIIITISGTLEQILTKPIFTLEQITNIYWIIYLTTCFTFVFFAYFILWPRNTLNFERKLYLGSEIIFGIIWGFSTGGILLSFYHLWSLTGVLPWINYILAFISISLWQYFIQAYFWDIYVSPEHDTPRSILIKTFTCHLPNVLLSLGFLSIWGNYTIFISFFIIALVSSTIFQRFPAPWAKGKFHAPAFKSGIMGYPYGSGYIEKT